SGDLITDASGKIICGNDQDKDPNNELQTLSRSGTNICISNTGSCASINDADADPNNELQTLSLSGNNLCIQSGNCVTLPDNTPTLNWDIVRVDETIVGTCNFVTYEGPTVSCPAGTKLITCNFILGDMPLSVQDWFRQQRTLYVDGDRFFAINIVPEYETNSCKMYYACNSFYGSPEIGVQAVCLKLELV
ncbi:MAG: hypothetical protein GXN99_00965, partial [Candidatus Nanohaloarchaeota archaeon]|nr:hypothetical protein [Candidatus Nanohaloarchaeota archaeon]